VFGFHKPRKWYVNDSLLLWIEKNDFCIERKASLISFFDLSLPIYYGEQLPLWTSFNIPAKPALEVAIDQNSDRYLHIPLKFSLTAFKSQTDRQHWTVGWSSKADIFHATKISRACKVDRAPNNSRALRLIQIYDFISLQCLAYCFADSIFVKSVWLCIAQGPA